MTDYIYSIEAKNVNKTFKKKNIEINALKNFNIKIKKGSIHGLLGPNGAGKSTFINILGSLVKKNTGNISICGIDIDKNQKLAKFKIGIVGNGNTPGLTEFLNTNGFDAIVIDQNKSKEFFTSTGHWSKLGNQRASEKILRHLSFE